MDFKRNYLNIAIIYLFVGLYVVFDNNSSVTFILIVFLMIFHYMMLVHMKDKLSEDKKLSVNKLITKLDETQKETEETYSQFISLSKLLGSGVLLLDDQGFISFSNRDITEIFGMDFNQISYESLQHIKPLYKFLNHAYLVEKKYQSQIYYQDRYYDMRSRPIFENELFRGCLVVVNDITSLRMAEHFQKQFTADVSHELKTPLATIKGMSEILVRDVDMDLPDRIDFTETIYKEAIRMESILKDLLIISKMDRIDYELTVSKLNLKDLINDTVQLLIRYANQKDITIQSKVIDDVLVEVDKTKMEQVFINLLKNAINYTDEGTITISSSIVDRYVKIEITDTGIGIEQDNLQNIFKRFYRVDNARSRDTGGSGLGLSIVKNVVLKHNGKIDVISKINQGTTFIIYLPYVK